jgi:putative peptidoglycan lipid II flippase
MMGLKVNLFKSSVLLSVGLLLGRISGYFREMVIASVYHVSDTSDKVLLILTVPDFINNLLSVTTVGAIVLPLMAQQQNYIEYIVRYSIKKLLYLSGFLMLIFLIFVSLIYDVETLLLIAISLISVIPNIILSVFVVFLNSRNKFFLPSLGTLIFNTALIFVLISTSNLYLISIGVILAAFIRLLSVFFNSISIGLFSDKERDNSITINFSYKALLLAVVSNGILFINPLIDKVFASHLNSGSLTILSYSEKIYLLPVSIYLTSMAVTSFPTFVTLSSTNRFLEFISLLRRLLFISFGLGLFTSVCFFYFNDFIVNAFFGIAGLSRENLNKISDVTLAYIPMLVFSGINAIIMNALYALKRFQAILFISLSLVFMKFALNFWMVSTNLGVLYIALGTSFMGLMQFLLGLLALMYFMRIGFGNNAMW